MGINYAYAQYVGSELVGRFTTPEAAMSAVNAALDRIARKTFYPRMVGGY